MNSRHPSDLDDAITAIIPFDDIAAALDATPLDDDAHGRQSRWPYAPSRAETTQDILVSEVEFDGTVATRHAFAADTFTADIFLPSSLKRPAEITPESAPGRVRTGGKHRIVAPPRALKGRVALVALAAGAAVAGTVAEQIIHQPTSDAATDDSKVAHANAVNVQGADSQADMAQFTQALPMGKLIDTTRTAKDLAGRRPLFVLPAIGEFTSTFGTRWSTMHLGVDIAGPIGTPIVSVADGTVLEAGPASGFGLWVVIQHADDTISVYGHVDTMEVTVGQHVLAGDQIATIGNRGDSTGPHLHFEIWVHHMKIDPLGWLATRGISLGHYYD